MSHSTSLSSVVKSVVASIEKEILPRLQGAEPFQAVAVAGKSRYLCLPADSSTAPHMSRVPGGSVSWQKADDLTLAYVVQGEVVVHAGRRRMVCSAGHFVLLFPAAWRAAGAHWFGPSAKNAGHILWLTLKPGMIVCHTCRLQDGAVYEAKALFVPDNRLHPLALQLGGECGEAPNPTAARRLLWLFFDRVRRKLREDGFLMTRPIPENPSPGDPAQNIGEKALRYVEANLMEKLTLESVARAIFSTRTRVARDFKTHTGMPLGAYLQRRRLELARQFLTTTTDSIATIARRSGFSDADYFCAAFRKSEGLTPSQYRQKGG